MDLAAFIIVIIGSINWIIIGASQLDIASTLFGGLGAVITRVFYIIVGLAGLWCGKLAFFPKRKR